MAETTIGANEAHLLNPHYHETALNLAQAAFTISYSVALLSFVVVQYLLAKIQFSKSKLKPTTLETIVGLIALWIGHRILDLSISKVIYEMISTIWGREIALDYQDIRFSAAVGSKWVLLVPASWTWQRSVTLIFCEVFVTWLMSTSIFLSISMAPQMKQAHQNPSKALARFQCRCFELVNFVGTLFQERASPVVKFDSTITIISKPDPGDICDNQKHRQSIELRRHQDENLADGPRTLNWDLKVDQDAMREMMETLGPPGMLSTILANVFFESVF